MNDDRMAGQGADPGRTARSLASRPGVIWPGVIWPGVI